MMMTSHCERLWKRVPGCGTGRREAVWSVSWQSIARDCQVTASARP